MVRLHLFAEGRTEQTFADTVLKPHLASLGVYMQKPSLIAHARRKRRTHRGGGRNYQAMQNDIERRRRQEPGRGVYFTTMIDLYALHAHFPGAEEAENWSDPYRRVEVLENAWLDATGDNRFIPFIQLHEFEAYLFCDVSRFSLFFENAGSRISTLQRVVEDFGSPELIDDGQHSAPSKRISAQFPEYQKTTVGPQMAKLIGLETIRCRCPHFRAWIEGLERLGTLPEEKTGAENHGIP